KEGRMSGGGVGTRTRVGRYELGRTLGEGSFAKVKYARDVRTGNSFAIKILDKQQVLRHKMVEQVRELLLAPLSFVFNFSAYRYLVNMRRVMYKKFLCFLLQIKREISTMKLIKHPNVVQIYEVL
ncbi:hypothetical protein B296_00009598, partial [Ensete ventricosum]